MGLLEQNGHLNLDKARLFLSNIVHFYFVFFTVVCHEQNVGIEVVSMKPILQTVTTL